MKLNSVRLNPFQPFPERDSGAKNNVGPSTSIEDNLSRSVISALANAEDTSVLAEFLQALAKHGSPPLRKRIEKITEAIRDYKTQEAISLQANLDFSSLPNCGEDIAALQKLLQDAVASISLNA